MASLAVAIDTSTGLIQVNAPLDVGPYRAPYTLDSENVLVTSGDSTAFLTIVRGQNGTAPAAHAAGTTLTAGWGGGAAPSAIYVSAADPGAIGARNLWLEVLFADPQGDGGDGRLWARNSTDDGWNSASPLTFSDAIQTLIGSPGDVAELGLRDDGASYLQDPTTFKLSGGNKSLFLDAAGLHLGGDANAPLLITGSADPSAGGGVAAAAGSLYLRASSGVGTFWQKIGVGDTAWAQVGFRNTSLAGYQALGDISLTTADGGTLTLFAPVSGNIVLAQLPVSDPAVVGALWNDVGTLKVSAG